MDDSSNPEISDLKSNLKKLEQRIAILENKLGIVHHTPVVNEQQTLDGDSEPATVIANTGTGMESRIGGYGLGLLGSIVFLFGIIFLSEYISSSGYPFFSAIFGYVSVAGIFLIARYFKKTVTHLSFMFNMAGQFLLYYVTLRLHYFSDTPLIPYRPVALSLVLLVFVYQLIISYRKKSELYLGIAVVLALTTGIINSSTAVMLSVGVLCASGAVYFFFRNGWKGTLILSIFLVYLTFLIWFLLKTMSGTTTEAAALHQYCHIYLCLTAAIFSLVPLTRDQENTSANFIFGSVIFNGIFFSLLLLIFGTTFFTDNYTYLFIVISAFCMIYSILLKSYSKWKFADSLYAMYGFVALSVSVYGILQLPYTHLLLCFQSLYVVIIALWFRSKVLIYMNTALFLLLLPTYLITSESVDIINFSFVFVAIATSRIINWKRQVLEIPTNIILNIYLIITFFTILYALFKAIPAQYITLSWTITAIIYFIFSIILKNVKYRWMAISTIVSAAFYLFIIDLSRISIVYRIIAFLFVAVISIGISVYYSNVKKKQEELNEQSGKQDEADMKTEIKG